MALNAGSPLTIYIQRDLYWKHWLNTSRSKSVFSSLAFTCMQQFPKCNQAVYNVYTLCGPCKCEPTDSRSTEAPSSDFFFFLQPFKFCNKWIQTLSNMFSEASLRAWHFLTTRQFRVTQISHAAFYLYSMKQLQKREKQNETAQMTAATFPSGWKTCNCVKAHSSFHITADLFVSAS